MASHPAHRLNFLLLLLSVLTSLTQSETNITLKWDSIDFSFESDTERESWLNTGKFIPQNVAISDIKVSKDSLFFSIPRDLAGVPATLATLPYNSTSPGLNSSSAVLVPFPSWKKNRLKKCSGFQNVQTIEIDQFDRLWILDSGNAFGSKSCRPKLVIIDLNRNKTVRNYEFSSRVVKRTEGTFSAVAVGCLSKHDCWAYVFEPNGGKIIIYNYAMNKSWYVRHPTMRSDTLYTKVFNVTKDSNSTITGRPSIALSPLDTGFSHLFFSPSGSSDLYRMSIAKIRPMLLPNRYGIPLSNSQVEHIGSLLQRVSGMTMDSKGILYYGLKNGSIASWDSYRGNLSEVNQNILIDSDHGDAATVSIDSYNNGLLAFTTENFQKSSNESITNSTGYRLVRTEPQVESYMYSRQPESRNFGNTTESRDNVTADE